MNGLETAVKMTREFCDKVGVSPRTRLATPRHERGENSALYDAEVQLSHLSRRLALFLDRPRANRAHLMVEELSELMAAMREGDEVKALDALADLLYVVLGTADTFDLPVAAAFAEVHRSNMTKEAQADDPERARCRDKGPRYSPPDLEGVLREHRAVCHCGTLVREHSLTSSCLNPQAMDEPWPRKTPGGETVHNPGPMGA